MLGNAGCWNDRFIELFYCWQEETLHRDVTPAGEPVPRTIDIRWLVLFSERSYVNDSHLGESCSGPSAPLDLQCHVALQLRLVLVLRLCN